ncbi:hypothetical protein CVT26_008418, partial [Gymnopilus dilepis]
NPFLFRQFVLTTRGGSKLASNTDLQCASSQQKAMAVPFRAAIQHPHEALTAYNHADTMRSSEAWAVGAESAIKAKYDDVGHRPCFGAFVSSTPADHDFEQSKSRRASGRHLGCSEWIARAGKPVSGARGGAGSGSITSNNPPATRIRREQAEDEPQRP